MQGGHPTGLVSRRSVLHASIHPVRPPPQHTDPRAFLPLLLCTYAYTARWLRPVLLSSVFGVTRIAGLPTDHLVNTPHPSPSRTISVLVRDQVYLLPVLSPEGRPLPVEEIEAGLWGVCEDVAKLQSSDLQPPVGNLTATGRDEWTRAREHLLSISPANRVALSSIEESLFTVCLDDSTRPAPSGELPSSSTGTLPTKGLDAHIVTASANVDGRNRWFDKSFQVIVESNSRSSLNGEHSPCDALIPSIVSDYAQAEGVGKGEPDASLREKGRKGELGGGWERVKFVTDGKILEDIQAAKAVVVEIQKDSDGKMLWFDDYGADWIKKSGKQSPDAYIQLAMQLAWYREQGWATPTYETASTRLFRKGRTDVIRTLSEDSYKFVKSMDDPSADVRATRFSLGRVLIRLLPAGDPLQPPHGRHRRPQQVHPRLLARQRLRPAPDGLDPDAPTRRRRSLAGRLLRPSLQG